MVDDARDYDRVVPLDGGHNFRDIGGYATRDGRHVAKGLVFRSGTMSELTPRDHDIFETLGVRFVYDLRSNNERSKRPSRFPDDCRFEVRFRDHEVSDGDITKKIRAKGANASSVRIMAIESYRTLAYEQAHSYRELFLHIAYDPLPLVFHCSAGKDRTGIAAALLHELLGVDRAEVIADYVLTDRFAARAWDLIAKDPFGASLSEVDRAVWAPIVRADPVYLETMFETLEQRHGSTIGFVREELSLGDDDINAIRARLLV